MHLLVRTGFVKAAPDRDFSEAWFGSNPRHPQALTHVVLQPPAGGARLALNAWAVGALTTRLNGPRLWRVEVLHDALHWVHVAGPYAQHATDPVATLGLELFDRCDHHQRQAGTNWQRWCTSGCNCQTSSDCKIQGSATQI